MKKILPVLVLVLFSVNLFAQEIQYTVLSSDNQSVVIQVDFPDLEKNEILIDGESHFKLGMDGAYHLLEAGAPEVLMTAQSIVIPEGANPTVEILFERFVQKDTFNLVPSKGKLYRNVDPSTVPYVKSDIYDTNVFYPQQICRLGENYQLRDLHGVAITVYPTTYNPVEKILREYTQIVVKINYNTTKTNQKQPKVTKEFKQIYKDHFINYESKKYDVVEEDGVMLIVAPTVFFATLQPLVDWKIKSGIPTEIVSIEHIGNTQTALLEFLKEYYNNNNLTYVLLVGDSRQVPSYRLGGESNDNVYAEVAGSDRYPDYFLGRFSAENTVDLEIQVRKTMMYESAPAEVSHFPVYAGIASREGPGDNREYDYQHIRKIGNKLAAYTYTSGYEFFEGSQGGLDASGTPQAQDVSDAINQGVGIINYCGHGDWNMFVTSYFMNQHVEALRNYNKLPFIISTACSNGDYYDQTCFAEKWLRAQQDGKPTGAVATLMSSIVQAWSPPMAGQDEMADLITENMSGHVKRTFGGIVFNGLCKILDVYNDYSTTRTWLIFGDPSLHIRTAVPQTLAIDHVDTICRNYPNYLTLTSSVEDVDVTLSANGKILKQAFIANAPLSIAVSDLDQYDTIYVVGTKYNHTPYMGILRGVTCSSPPPDPTEYKVESGILYPNPAIDYISISEKDFPDGKDVSCYIFDMNGKQILHILKNKGDNKIDIQKFTSGSYVLKMMADGKEIQTYKFVVI